MALTKAEQEELELLELEEQEAQHLANQKEPEKEEPSSGIEFLKLISNPGLYAAEAAAKKVSETDPEAALEGFGEGVSQGYLSNLQAALEKPSFAVMSALSGKDIKGDDYLQARDYYNQRQAKLKEESPGSFYGGQIAGTLAATSPTAALTKAPSVAGRVAKSGAVGAGLGFLQNTAEKEGDLGSLDLGQRLESAAYGAGLGTLFQGAAEAYGARSLIKNKVLDFLSVKDATMKQNAAEIAEASRKLGVKPTASMLKNSEELARLEDVIASDPVFGQSLSKQRNQIYGGVQKGIEGVTGERTSLTPFEVGERFKSNMAARVGETFDQPVSLFNKVAEDTRNIPLSEKSISSVRRNIENIPGIGLSDKALGYAKELNNLKSADDVKTLMTNLNADLSTATGADLIALGKIKPKLQNLEKNSIVRAAIQSSATKKAGEKTAQEILSELAAARKGYAQGMSELGQIAEAGGLSQPRSPMNFIDKVQSVTSEKIPEKFYNLGDYSSIKSISQVAPEEASLLRQSRLADIYNKSFNGEKISAANFLRQTNKMQPEIVESLFKEQAPLVRSIETVTDAYPKNFNPSGSTTKAQLTDFLNPTKLASGALNYAKYAATNAPRSIQGATPEIYAGFMGQVLNMPQQQVEQPTDRAERINQERKVLRGK